jgi:hypothetical protein
MKARRVLITVGLVAGILAAENQAFARLKKHHPAPAAAVVPAAPVKDPNLKKFKELPVNAVFCFPSDINHEWFPLVKTSPTEAKTLVTHANPHSTSQVVSVEATVYLAKQQHPAGQ